MMKLSVFLPDAMAKEVRILADETRRPVSWWIQRAWDVARSRLLQEGRAAEASHRKFLKTLDKLQGGLQKSYPGIDSVALAHQAFTLPRKK